MKEYLKLVFSIRDEFHDPVISELVDMGIDAFEQKPDQLITYVNRKVFSVQERDKIGRILEKYPGHNFISSEEVVTDQNWNEEWEKSISPREIDRFMVKPSWSRCKVPEDKIELIIDPKMSFGTGYHETTQLMLELLQEIVNGGDEVLDAGTGTGILAIASAKLGASHVLAFDIDEWSVQNAGENVSLNSVESTVEVREGSFEVVDENEMFNVVLANINRNTIVDYIEALSGHIKENGYLLLSGLLESDKESIMALREISSFEHIKTGKKNEWIAILLKNLSK